MLPTVLNTRPGQAGAHPGPGRNCAASQGYKGDWSGLFAGLVMAMLPVLAAYIVFQRQVRGRAHRGRAEVAPRALAAGHRRPSAQRCRCGGSRERAVRVPSGLTGYHAHPSFDCSTVLTGGDAERLSLEFTCWQQTGPPAGQEWMSRWRLRGRSRRCTGPTWSGSCAPYGWPVRSPRRRSPGRTGLSAATVSNIVRELKDGGTVEVTPTSAGGRRARSVSLSGDAGIVIGVDFGHTHLRVAVGNLAHQVLAEESEPLDVDASAAQGFDRAEQLVSRLIAGHRDRPRARSSGVGLGVPGPIDVESGTLGSTVDPARLDRHQARARSCAGRLGVPVHVDNDANLGRARRAGLGQRPRGAGPGLHQGRQRCRRRSGDRRADLPRARAARRARSGTSRWTSRARSAAAATAAAWRPSRPRATCCRCSSPATATDLTMEGVVQLARDGRSGLPSGDRRRRPAHRQWSGQSLQPAEPEPGRPRR